jgi:undecaprenyl diphosphate synthase
MDAPNQVRSIGIIMDGNRRWARARGLPTLEGHRRGYEKMKEVLDWVKEAGIRDVIMWGFSTENWKRSPEEVGYLMDLFRRVLTHELPEIKEKGGRLKFPGQRERFADDIQKLMADAEVETKDGGYTLWFALSYGGRAEILMAAERLVKEGKEITEENFGNALWTAGMPDPDIIIRTSGEERLSGFLPWQGVYSELFFLPVMWPDFSKEDFQKVLADYAARERRQGK